MKRRDAARTATPWSAGRDAGRPPRARKDGPAAAPKMAHALLFAPVMKLRAHGLAPLLVSTMLAACSGNSQPPGGRGSDGGTPPGPPGTPVAAALTAEQQAEVDRLKTLLAQTQGLTAEQLGRQRAVPWKPLAYDPRAAKHLELIQASSLKLDEAELGALGRNGFVISDKKRYPHFGYGYKTIYSQDLPVFISADSILRAVHQSYDDILKAIEIEALIPELSGLLAAMSTKLTSSPAIDAVTRRDADLFLTVGASLLAGKPSPSPANLAAADSKTLFDLAQAASGSKDMVLFGVERTIDFSQFKPRGHYTDSPELERYFRTMMWLGRIDFPFLHTNPATGKPELVRRSVAAALALRSLMDEAALARWKRIDATVRGFVGEPDSMAPPEVDRLKADLGLAAGAVALDGISDEALAQAIVKGAYGKQRILSQIVMHPPHDDTWPLDATFLFFGQRYVFDSHVFSNLVYDRVNSSDPAVPKRMMPSPLDAAYAALGNDQAVALLAPELQKYRYAGALESMRRLGDEHGSAFWEANLYNLWLGALRALSPGADMRNPQSGLPTVAATEAWGRRVLNTQLASWAELRHDTILYAKQSYTSGVACEFPDAYVEPYPAFFAQIEKLAGAGTALVSSLPLSSSSYLGPRIGAYWKRLREVAAILREMAEHQRSGLPHKAEHLAFVNQVVDLNLGCGGPAGIRGWYAELFFQPAEAAFFDPTIADVHTQPTDELGADVGHVLHVGTGWARLAVVTVDTCAGPRAYAGVVSSYHELVTEKLQRLNDQEWAQRFGSQTGAPPPADVSWMQDLIVR
jgi:hypothetical protein